MTLKEQLKKLFQDESGQALTEYVLLLAVLASMIIGLGIAFKNKIKKLVEGPLGNYLSQRFFTPASLHTFRIHIPK